MPEIGEIINDRTLGKRGHGQCIWAACELCGKQRWVASKNGIPLFALCNSCNKLLSGNGRWKGGKKLGRGYVLVKLHPSDFFYYMSDKNGYVSEHRLVVAKYLGRCLWVWEVVHHRNGNRADNRLTNLQLLTHSDHSSLQNKKPDKELINGYL